MSEKPSGRGKLSGSWPENSVCHQNCELLNQNTQNDEISSLALGRVLVLDDEMLVLNVIESVLHNRGYDVWITNDSDQALEILRAHEADILILDLVMPGKSGIEFYRELKQEKIVIPTIVLTASDNKEDHVLALREGIDDFLKKPFEADVLVANVEKLIKKDQEHKNAYLQDGLTTAYTRRFLPSDLPRKKRSISATASFFRLSLSTWIISRRSMTPTGMSLVTSC